nr:hypothetical protein [Brucella anthropi]
MTDLITRLSKLDAPDREVDGIIAEIFGYPQEVFGDSFGTDDVDGPEMHYDAATWSGEGKSWSAPYFTASVDAVIALAARELPGANVLMGWGQTNETKPWARIGVTPSHDATGFNLATALLIALLRAKEATNGQ